MDGKGGAEKDDEGGTGPHGLRGAGGDGEEEGCDEGEEGGEGDVEEDCERAPPQRGVGQTQGWIFRHQDPIEGDAFFQR